MLKKSQLSSLKRLKFNMYHFSTSENIFSNKETYIMSKWVADFPTHAGLTYEEVSSLSSRSRDINSWFKKTSEEFILYKEAPEWFLNAGKEASDWSLEIQEKYAFVKTLNKEYSDTINKISLKAKEEMASLDLKHKERLTLELSKTPELVFELFNSQMLPIETHLKAFEFNTKEEAKEFINNQVKEFKTETYELFLSGEINSEELVSMLFEK